MTFWDLRSGMVFTAAGKAGARYRVKWYNRTVTAIRKEGKGNPEILLPTPTVLSLISDDPQYQDMLV